MVNGILGTQAVEILMRVLTEDWVERGELRAGRQRLLV
jgi:hypothetical protein